MSAWNGWYHVNGNTYGTWLPGDSRGWRERKHKKHVDGDYKHPPPAGSGEPLRHYAQHIMKQPQVRLAPNQRNTAGRAMVDFLLQEGVEVIAYGLDAIHFHLLGRFPTTEVRPLVGRAKKHACFLLKNEGFAGRLWGAGSNVVPVTDRRHQVKVFDYIVRHGDQGAWVWTFREGAYWREGCKG